MAQVEVVTTLWIYIFTKKKNTKYSNLKKSNLTIRLRTKDKNNTISRKPLIL